MPLEFAHPDHRHSIRCHEERVGKDLAQGRIVLRFTDTMNTSNRYIAPLPAAHRIKKKFPCAVLIKNADSDAEHVYSFDLHSENPQRLNIFRPCGRISFPV